MRSYLYLAIMISCALHTCICINTFFANVFIIIEYPYRYVINIISSHGFLFSSSRSHFIRFFHHIFPRACSGTPASYPLRYSSPAPLFTQRALLMDAVWRLFVVDEPRPVILRNWEMRPAGTPFF